MHLGVLVCMNEHACTFCAVYAGIFEGFDEFIWHTFGIQCVCDCCSWSVCQTQNARVGRALQRLSQELYSKDAHFVLELVQNADDNSYPDEADFMPALEFQLYEDRIVVLNNELGFSENNIRALCDVGRWGNTLAQYL
jgi:hypothetical protein